MNTPIFAKTASWQHAVLSLKGESEISSLFEFHLQVQSDLPLKGVGEAIHIHNNDQFHIHGVIDSINASFLGKTVINHIRIVPALLGLKESSKNRVWEGVPLWHAIEEVLKYHKISLINKATNVSNKQEYVVQYQQTDWEFCISRLAKAGLNFVFEHTNSASSLIIFNAINQLSGKYHYPNTLIYDYGQSDKFMLEGYSTQSHQIVQGLESSSYDFTQATKREKMAVGKQNSKQFEHPTQADKQFIQHYLDNQTTNQNTITITTQEFLHPGTQFKLLVWGKEAEYVVLRAQYSVDFDPNKSAYNFKALLTAAPKVNFKTYMPKEIVFSKAAGLLLGTVIEKVDQYGRVRVRMMWDEKFINNKEDQKDSCWVRVMQHGSGAMSHFYVPSIGDEVIIGFEMNDIEKPFILGTLVNSNNMPEHDPSSENKSYWKMFKNEDKEKFNKITFDANKDKSMIEMIACQDLMMQVGENHTTNITKGDFVLSNQEGNYKCDLKKGNHTTILEEGNMMQEVKKGNHTIILEEGDIMQEVKKGDYKINIEQGQLSVNVKGDVSFQAEKKVSLKFDQELDMKVGKKRNCVIESGDNLTINSGNYVISIKSGELTIDAGKNIEQKAMKINIKAQTDLVLEGLNVNIKGKAGIKLEAPTIECNAQAMLKMKSGACASVEGGALTQIKGALVKIN